MTDRLVQMRNRHVKRPSVRGSQLIALTWLMLMEFQLVRSMRIDAYELTQSHFDLLGFWFAIVLSIMLASRMYRSRSIMLTPVILVFLLIIYISLLSLVTAPYKSLISLLFSRYGLIMWFVLGLGFSAILEILRKNNFELGNRWPRRLTLAVIIFLSVPALLFAQEIILSPVLTLSYQAVSSNAIIYLLIIACTLIAVWGKTLSLTLSFAFFGLASALVSAVVLLQSTSIVAFWLGLITVFTALKFRHSRIAGKLAIALLVLLALKISMGSEFFDTIGTTTRFSVFFTGEGKFTSATSRLDILDTFWAQFAVSPIFGHFEAEIVAGVGEGNYIHSLPLSFLTHTGILGFGVISTILIALLRGRMEKRKILDPLELFLVYLMWIILILGTLSVFMTWSVFWFMLGCLCHRPTISKNRIKYASDN
jgi:O-antigen ligase